MWKTALTTFAAVFIAELGDKTQLATFGMAAQERSRLPVFIGAATALVASSALAVLAGGALAKWIQPIWIQRAAGVLFLAIGGWTLWRSTVGG